MFGCFPTLVQILFIYRRYTENKVIASTKNISFFRGGAGLTIFVNHNEKSNGDDRKHVSSKYVYGGQDFVIFVRRLVSRV